MPNSSAIRRRPCGLGHCDGLSVEPLKRPRVDRFPISFEVGPRPIGGMMLRAAPAPTVWKGQQLAAPRIRGVCCGMRLTP